MKTKGYIYTLPQAALQCIFDKGIHQSYGLHQQAGAGWLAGGLQAVLLNIPSQPILTIKRVNIQCHSTLHIRT